MQAPQSQRWMGHSSRTVMDSAAAALSQSARGLYTLHAPCTRPRGGGGAAGSSVRSGMSIGRRTARVAKLRRSDMYSCFPGRCRWSAKQNPLFMPLLRSSLQIGVVATTNMALLVQPSVFDMLAGPILPRQWMVGPSSHSRPWTGETPVGASSAVNGRACRRRKHRQGRASRPNQHAGRNMTRRLPSRNTCPPGKPAGRVVLEQPNRVRSGEGSHDRGMSHQMTRSANGVEVAACMTVWQERREGEATAREGKDRPEQAEQAQAGRSSSDWRIRP